MPFCFYIAHGIILIDIMIINFYKKFIIFLFMPRNKTIKIFYENILCKGVIS